MTAVLIAATCIFLNLALSRAGMFYMDKLGQAIFGVGCGLITCFIRRFGSYPEGVCYSILIMNCTTWLLDKYIRPTIYGAIKKDKKEAAAK